MKNYEFEYVNNNYLLWLILACCLTFFISIIALFSVFDQDTSIYLLAFLSSIIPFCIYWFNRKKIKKFATAILDDNHTEINHSGVTEFVNFKDINNYKIQTYDGSSIAINRNDDSKIRFNVNPNFCEIEKFNTFCLDLQTAIENYKVSVINAPENATTTAIVTKKSFYESAWILPVLIIVTLILLLILVGNLSDGGDFPYIIIAALLPLGRMWTGYFMARNKKKANGN